MAKKAAVASQMDVEIGTRIRIARRERQLSQKALGTAVGITFQQMQKYEKGDNRVSVTRLYRDRRATRLAAHPFRGRPRAAPRDRILRYAHAGRASEDQRRFEAHHGIQQDRKLILAQALRRVGAVSRAGSAFRLTLLLSVLFHPDETFKQLADRSIVDATRKIARVDELVAEPGVALR